MLEPQAYCYCCSLEGQDSPIQKSALGFPLRAAKYLEVRSLHRESAPGPLHCRCSRAASELLCVSPPSLAAAALLDALDTKKGNTRHPLVRVPDPHILLWGSGQVTFL